MTDVFDVDCWCQFDRSWTITTLVNSVTSCALIDLRGKTKVTLEVGDLKKKIILSIRGSSKWAKFCATTYMSLFCPLSGANETLGSCNYLVNIIKKFAFTSWPKVVHILIQLSKRQQSSSPILSLTTLQNFTG